MARRLVVVHAHPDDESITMGGTLASAVADGVAVTLVTCTLGEQGEVIPSELQGLVAEQADQLGGYRHGELSRACAELGIADHRYLGGIGRYRDSGMAGAASARHPRALVRSGAGGAGFEAAVESLLAVLDERRAEVVVSYDSDGGYGHPDHIAAHQIARAAATRASSVRRFFAVVRPEEEVQQALSRFTPAPGYLPPQPSDLGFLVPVGDVDVQLPVAGVRSAHRRALAAHRTQIDLLDDGFALSNRIAQPVLDHEYYRLLDGAPLPHRAASDPPANDLFAGLDR